MILVILFMGTFLAQIFLNGTSNISAEGINDNDCILRVYPSVADYNANTNEGKIYFSSEFIFSVTNVTKNQQFQSSFSNQRPGEIYTQLRANAREYKLSNFTYSGATPTPQAVVLSAALSNNNPSGEDAYIDFRNFVVSQTAGNHSLTLRIKGDLGSNLVNICQRTITVEQDPGKIAPSRETGCCISDNQCQQWFGLGTFTPGSGFSERTSCGPTARGGALFASPDSPACGTGLQCNHPFNLVVDEFSSRDGFYNFIDYDDSLSSSPIIGKDDFSGNTYQVFDVDVRNLVTRTAGSECFIGFDVCTPGSNLRCIPNDASSTSSHQQCLTACTGTDGDCVFNRYSVEEQNDCDPELCDCTADGVVSSVETLYNTSISYDDFKATCQSSCTQRRQTVVNGIPQVVGYEASLREWLEVIDPGADIRNGFTAEGFACFRATSAEVCDSNYCELDADYDPDTEEASLTVYRTCLNDAPGNSYALSIDGLGLDEVVPIPIDSKDPLEVDLSGARVTAAPVSFTVVDLNPPPDASTATVCEIKNILDWNPDYVPGDDVLDPDGNTTGNDPVVNGPNDSNAFGVRNCPGQDNGTFTDEFYECRSCITLGGTWTGLGCLSTTPAALFANLARIGLGIMGGVALLRLIYLGFLYQTGDESKISEARQGVLSTLGAIVLVLFSVLLLQVIGVNILDIVPEGFFISG